MEITGKLGGVGSLLPSCESGDQILVVRPGRRHMYPQSRIREAEGTSTYCAVSNRSRNVKIKSLVPATRYLRTANGSVSLKDSVSVLERRWVKGTCCSCSGPTFGSQHSDKQLTAAPGHLILLTLKVSAHTHTHTPHTHPTNTHTYN